MSRKLAGFYILLYFSFFLLLTPLGVFNDWIPPAKHTGYYSATLIDSGDDAGYYAYLRSIYFDGDLDFANERKFSHAEGFTKTGYVANNWQMGQAILFFPFLLIGHLLAGLCNQWGGAFSLDGYSAPYYLATAIASGTWLFAGLIFLHRLLAKFCSQQAALISVTSLWLASPLIYFSFIRQRMAHTSEFFLVVLLLWVWIENRKNKEWDGPVLMGLTAGLLCLVRPINIGFLALFFVDQLYLYLQDSTTHRGEKIHSFVRRSAGFFLAFFLALAPQVVCWYQLNGVPFPARSVGMAGQGLAQFSFMAVLEKAGRIFFSPQWGLVWSMPLALAGAIGLLVSSAKLKSLKYGLLAYLFALFAIVLLYPEDSVSYGKRHFISAVPIVAIGLALLWDRLGERRLWKGFAFVAILICIFAQYLLLIQYKVVLPYNHPEYTWEALSTASQLLWDRPDLLLRSTNWLSLLPMEKFWDLTDKLFLIGFPVLQFIAVFGTVFLVNEIRWNVSKRALSLGGILFCFVLSGVVYFSAPTFSQEKIEARKSYQKNMQTGRAFLQQRKFAQALENFKSASVLEPQLNQPFLNAGVVLQLDHKNREAIPWFEKALQLAPDDAMTLFNTGKTLAELGDFDRAQGMMQKGIRLQPLFKPAYVFLGEIFLRKNEPGNALQAFQTLLALNPKDGSSHARLAMVYTILNESDRAKAHLQEAIALGGDPGMIRAVQDFYKTQ
jgi:tetratricopeptide (TPR) repeat protein